MMCNTQATMEWEAQDEGFLAKILMPEGSKDVPVGTHVAVVVEEAESVRPPPQKPYNLTSANERKCSRQHSSAFVSRQTIMIRQRRNLQCVEQP